VSTTLDKDGQASSAPTQSTSDRIARRVAAWCEAGLAAAALPLFPLLVIAPRGVAVLISVAGLCAAGLALSSGGPKPRLALATPAALLGCILLWGTASAIWSVDWLRSLIVAARLAGLFAAGLALVWAADSIRAPRRLAFVLLGSLFLAVALRSCCCR